MEHVQRRGGRYYWRARLPADLAAASGRREIVRALETAEPAVARERAARLNLELSNLWQGARTVTGTADELRGLLESLLAALDESTSARRRALGVRPSSLAVEAITAIQDLAHDAKLELPTLLWNVDQAEKASGNTARATAVAGAMPPEALVQLRELLGSLGVRSAVTATPKALAFLSDTYTAERRLREDAHRHVDGYVRTFVRAVGDRPLADYKRADIVRWIRTLEKLRTSYGKRKGDDTKALAQIIKETQAEPTLGRTTIEKHITHLRAFFLSANKHHRWSARDEIDDLFNDVPLSDFVPGAKPRKSWTISQLNQLFSSPTWSGTRSRRDDVTHRHEPGPQVHRDAYWWLPVAALWTGARLEELAQLHHSDLAQDRGGIHYLRITDEEGRKVKTAHSVRNVPVHRFLRDIGFCDLFRPGGKGRIWPELRQHGRPPSWGALYSTHFTDYRRACGLYEPLRDFHSFRRTVVSLIRNKAGVDALTVAALVGHDDSDPELRRVRQTDDYTDYDVSALSAAMEKLDYVAYGLDVDVLVRTAAACGPRGDIHDVGK